MASKLITCLNCGWVSFEVSRRYAQSEVKRFNAFYRTLDKKGKEMYGNKPASVDFYEECLRCGGSYKDFKKAKKADCPVGCTINPVIAKGD